MACNATEVILFERTTFLVVATSSNLPDIPSTASSLGSATTNGEDARGLDPTRYERTSELVKAFKYACSRVREEFHSLEMELYDFTAILAEMTRNTYVMVIVHDPTIGLSIVIYLAPTSNGLRCAILETAALKLNVRMARRKFEELQGDSVAL